MKLLLFFSLFGTTQLFQDFAADYHHSGGRCTGSANCSACSNCKYCKHCAQEGGTCGVCASSRSSGTNSFYNSNSSGGGSGSGGGYYYSAPRVIQEGSTVIVAVSTLNVRSQPSTNGRILTKVNHGQSMIVQSVDGDWLLVKFYTDNPYEGYVIKSAVQLL